MGVMEKMKTSEKIRLLRLNKGLTQEELGELIGVQKSAINKYEKGRVENIKRSTFVRLAEALDVEPGDLLDDEDSAELLIPVTNQSMAPTLQAGDKVLVKAQSIFSKDDSIYYIQDNKKPYLARLNQQDDGVIKVSFDNKRSKKSHLVTPAELDAGDMQIIGIAIQLNRDL